MGGFRKSNRSFRDKLDCITDVFVLRTKIRPNSPGRQSERGSLLHKSPFRLSREALGVENLDRGSEARGRVKIPREFGNSTRIPTNTTV
jgi:hypothetical protein